MKPAEVLLAPAVEGWNRVTDNNGGHVALVGGVRYVQPYVYLVAHLVEMWVAGWKDADFDTLAAVSGASALYGYQPREFMPKYAHLMVQPDERIAEATGFGYEWVPWEDAEGVWGILTDTLDTGTAVRGWDWENCLFAGYRSADRAEDRQVFTMADGPDTFSEWLTWEQFVEWAKRIGEWNQKSLGRHTTRVSAQPADAVAVRVMEDLVAWSEEPPANVRQQLPNATFGLAGIARYADDCGNVEDFGNWSACHDINPQWTVRNSTAVYLERTADAGLLPDAANAHLRTASQHYRDAFEAWREFYDLLGHHAPEGAGRMKDRRLAGAAQVQRWLAEETGAIGALRRALSLIEE